MKYLETQAFPIHANTVTGTLTDQSIEDLPYRLVHANAACDLTITYNGGASKTVSLAAGEDVVLVGMVVSISTTGDVKAS